MDGDQIRDAAAFDELGAHGVTRGLGGDHDDVQISAGHDLVVVDGETMSESEGGTLLQVRLDLVLVQLGLEFVGGQDHDHVGGSHGVLYRLDGQAMGFGLGDSGRAAAQTDDDIDAGVFQVAGVGVALGAVADDGDLLALDDGKVTVFIVVNAHCRFSWKRGYQMLRALSPREIPVTPLRTTSRMDAAPIAWMKLSIFSLVPAS